MVNTPDTFENRTRQRNKKKLQPSRLPADLKVEKQALAAELGDEEAKPSRTRRQSKADLYKSWWTANTYRRMRNMLFRFAPELQAPRFLPAVEMICSQQVLYRQLLDAHARQQEQYDALYHALQKFLDGLPPVKEINSETIEMMDKLHDLLKAFLGANPFQYVDKIENVAAKIFTALKDGGLTPKAARYMEINVEEELRQYLGEKAKAQEDDAPPVGNIEQRKRILKRDGDEPVGGSDEEPEGEEEDDQ